MQSGLRNHARKGKTQSGESTAFCQLVFGMFFLELEDLSRREATGKPQTGEIQAVVVFNLKAAGENPVKSRSERGFGLLKMFKSTLP